MIVVVAPFPGLTRVKDGSLQRFAWIDQLMQDQSRTYLDISFRHHRKAREHQVGQVTVLQLNAVLHFGRIVATLKQASVVYVHSVFNAIKVLPSFWLVPTITDLHGIVPEELSHHGHTMLAKVYGWAESLAVRRSVQLVCVTEAMRRHLARKYGDRLPRSAVIPILPELSEPAGPELSLVCDDRTVIYAGGTQRWQNVELMLDAAASCPQYRYRFLSDRPDVFEAGARERHIVEIECQKVPAQEVAAHYQVAGLGFILRDDIAINQVACPTKLVEYLHWGVIPIVLNAAIGDFAQLGFKYLLLDDFISGRVPPPAELTAMRAENRQVVVRMRAQSQQEISRLQATLTNGPPAESAAP